MQAPRTSSPTLIRTILGKTPPDFVSQQTVEDRRRSVDCRDFERQVRSVRLTACSDR